MKKEITLPSGITCVISEMFGKHQRILTQQGGGDITDNFNEVLTDIIHELGSLKVVSKEHVLEMLAPDRKEILIQSRHLTMGFDEPFEFNYEYFNEATKRKDKLALSINFEGERDFPVTTVKMKDSTGKFRALRFYHSFNKKEIKKLFTKSGFKLASCQNIWLNQHKKSVAKSIIAVGRKIVK